MRWGTLAGLPRGAGDARGAVGEAGGAVTRHAVSSAGHTNLSRGLPASAGRGIERWHASANSLVLECFLCDNLSLQTRVLPRRLRTVNRGKRIVSTQCRTRLRTPCVCTWIPRMRRPNLWCTVGPRLRGFCGCRSSCLLSGVRCASCRMPSLRLSAVEKTGISGLLRRFGVRSRLMYGAEDVTRSPFMEYLQSEPRRRGA